MKKIFYTIEVNGTQKILRNFDAITKEYKAQLKALRQIEGTGTAAYRQQETLVAKLKNEQTRLNGELKKTTKELSSQKFAAGSYRALNAELVRLRASQKELSREARNGFAGVKQQQRIRKLDAELKRLDKTMGQNQRNVGNYSKALGGLGRVAAAAGIGFGVTELVQGISRGIKVFADFSRQISFLGAVSQASVEDLAKLESNAKRLGESTQFTASQVAQLQIEFAKLGFTPAEILDATADSLNLAAVAQADLGETAQVVGSTLNAFNLDASESGRVTDVLASAFSNSALDLSKFRDSINKVAPIAAGLGFTLEDTTALLGTLTDAGFEASTAGTSLRSIFLNLADSNGALAKELGGSITSVDELAPALKTLEARGIDVASALELTDKRSVAAFKRFIDGADDVQKLSNQLKGSAGFAKRAGDAITNDLTGDLDRLSSVIEGVVIAFGDASDGILRGFVQAITGAVSAVKGFVFEEEKLSTTLAKTQLQFNAEIEALKAGNLSTENRAKLITSINQKYGEYLPNLLEETASLTEIEQAQSAANQAFEQRIILLAAEEQLAETARKRIENRAEALRLEIALQERLQGVSAAGQGSAARASNSRSGIDTNLSDAQNELQSVRDAIERNKRAEQELNDEFALSVEAAKDLGLEIDKIVGDSGSGVPNLPKIPRGPGKPDPDAKKEVEALKGSYDFLNQTISELEKQLQSVASTSERFAISEQIDDAKDKLEELNQGLLFLQNQADLEGREIITLPSIGIGELLNPADVGRLGLAQNKKNLEQALKEYEKTLIEQETAFNNSLKAGTTSSEQESALRLQNDLDALQRKKQILEQFGEDTLQIDRDISAKQIEIIRQRNASEIEEERKKEELRKTVLSSIKSAAFDIVKQGIDAAFAIENSNIEKEKNARLEALQEQYDARLRFVRKGSLEEKRITKELEEEKERVEEQANKRRKRAAIGSAIANGALAIIRQFADLPIYAAIPAAAVIAATTAFQITTINSTEYADGGILGDGTQVLSGGSVDSKGKVRSGSHASGKDMLVSTKSGLARLEGGEMTDGKHVINKKTARKNPALVSSLLAMPDSRAKTDILMGINYNRIPMFMEGGIFGTTTNIPAPQLRPINLPSQRDRDTTEIINRVDALITEVSRLEREKRVVLRSEDVTEFNDNSNQVDLLQNQI